MTIKKTTQYLQGANYFNCLNGRSMKLTGVLRLSNIPPTLKPATRTDFGGKCLDEFPDLEKHHTVHFTSDFCKEIEKMGFSYPNRWYVFMGRTPGGEYEFWGHRAGSFTVNASKACVKSTGNDMGIQIFFWSPLPF